MRVFSLPPSPARLPFVAPLPGKPTDAHFLKTTPLPGASFLELVSHVGKSTRDSLVRGEKLAKTAALGDSDPQEVAFAMIRAKEALHQFTVLVNVTLQACQELLKTGI